MKWLLNGMCGRGRKHRWRVTALAIMVLAVSSCGPTPGGAPAEDGELIFGVISTESAIGLRKDFAPLAEDLSAALGQPVRVFYAPDYAGVIEAMRFGKVHLAWLGNKAAIEAVDRAEAEVFAQTVAIDGSRGYWSVLIVHRDSPYENVDQLLADAAELAFGNGDPNSTSGYLIPDYYLWSQRAVNPQQTFKRVINSNHEANCLAVASKQVDVATNNNESVSRFAAAHPEFADQLRVIWKSPTIPSDPLVWRKDLPDELKGRIGRFFLDYGVKGPEAARHREVLAKIDAGWGPFAAADDSLLQPVREVMLARDLAEAKRRSDADRVKALEQELETLRAEKAAPTS